MAKKILIIDDEPDMLEILKFRLEKNGYKITTASSGEEGLKKAEKVNPDLILLDILLPGMSGLEVVKRMKKNRATKNIPIIMVTALISRDVKTEGLNNGAEYLISKPFDPAELLAEIKNVIEGKETIKIKKTR
ncbi:MAG: response regulator [Candidatus Omnitrophota bacterium]